MTAKLTAEQMLELEFRTRKLVDKNFPELLTKTTRYHQQIQNKQNLDKHAWWEFIVGYAVLRDIAHVAHLKDYLAERHHITNDHLQHCTQLVGHYEKIGSQPSAYQAKLFQDREEKKPFNRNGLDLLFNSLVGKATTPPFKP